MKEAMRMKIPRALAATLTCGVCLMAMIALPGHAFAGTTVCRTDPIVTLSNGQTITLWSSIGTDITTVSNVSYVLHIPANLQVTSVTHDQYASLESFSWVADQGGNRFEDDTTVTTSSPAGTVPVTAWASLPQGNNTFSASGSNGQTLAITWKS